MPSQHCGFGVTFTKTMIAAIVMKEFGKTEAMKKCGSIMPLGSVATSPQESSSATGNATPTMSSTSSDASLERGSAAAAPANRRTSSHTTSVTHRIRIAAAKGPTNAGDSVGGAGVGRTTTMTVGGRKGDEADGEDKEDRGVTAARRGAAFKGS